MGPGTQSVDLSRVLGTRGTWCFDSVRYPEAHYSSGAYETANPTWHAEDSPWKASKIAEMIAKHQLMPDTVAEVGCGAGGILVQLQRRMPNHMLFSGYELAPAAFTMASGRSKDRLRFYNEDIFAGAASFDLLLVIDVLEHVPDCYSFAANCRRKRKFKLYHIPLEIIAIRITGIVCIHY
jgi:2-polyprenyl-3-methyl-5-hydroxy-6-metoxy-1,4-benzoquinol methylase